MTVSSPPLQPFSEKSRTATVPKLFQIGLCGGVEADFELFWDSWSVGVLGERLYACSVPGKGLQGQRLCLQNGTDPGDAELFTAAALTALVDAAVPGGCDGAPLVRRSGLAWRAFSSDGAYVLRAIATLVWGTGSAGVRGAVSPALPPRVRAAGVATAVGGALDSAPAPMDVEAGVKGFSLAAWGSVTGWRPAAVRAVFSAYAVVQAAVVGDVGARYWTHRRTHASWRALLFCIAGECFCASPWASLSLVRSESRVKTTSSSLE